MILQLSRKHEDRLRIARIYCAAAARRRSNRETRQRALLKCVFGSSCRSCWSRCRQFVSAQHRPSWTDAFDISRSATINCLKRYRQQTLSSDASNNGCWMTKMKASAVRPVSGKWLRGSKIVTHRTSSSQYSLGRFQTAVSRPSQNRRLSERRLLSWSRPFPQLYETRLRARK